MTSWMNFPSTQREIGAKSSQSLSKIREKKEHTFHSAFYEVLTPLILKPHKDNRGEKKKPLSQYSLFIFNLI